jgi:hypothetical protein
VLSAIAFGDSLTARRAQVVNQQDHAQALRLLRDVLGNLMPDGQERRYRRILSFKDEAHYGARQASREEAGRLLADLEAFARWAQDLLQVSSEVGSTSELGRISSAACVTLPSRVNTTPCMTAASARPLSVGHRTDPEAPRRSR